MSKCIGWRPGCGVVEDKPYTYMLPDSPDYDYLISVRETWAAGYLIAAAVNDRIGYRALNVPYHLGIVDNPEIAARIAALRSQGRIETADALERYQTHVRDFLTSL